MINQKKLYHVVVSIFAFTGAVAIFVVAWWFIFGRSHEADTNINTGVVINSFAECEAAGYPVMESYPRQCAAGGKTFTEVITNTNSSANINSGFNPHTNTSDTSATSGWQIYTNSDLGITFQYPKEYGEVVFSENDGETGSMYNISFDGSSSLIIGGISNDYSAGREGSFLDSRGYYEEGGNYYFHFVDSKDDTEYPLNIVESLTVDSKNILLVNRYSFIGHDYINGPYLHPGDNALGALLVFQAGSKYPGMAIWDKNLNNISETTFKNILSTFQFTN